MVVCNISELNQFAVGVASGFTLSELAWEIWSQNCSKHKTFVTSPVASRVLFWWVIFQTQNLVKESCASRVNHSTDLPIVNKQKSFVHILLFLPLKLIGLEQLPQQRQQQQQLQQQQQQQQQKPQLQHRQLSLWWVYFLWFFQNVIGLRVTFDILSNINKSWLSDWFLIKQTFLSCKDYILSLVKTTCRET